MIPLTERILRLVFFVCNRCGQKRLILIWLSVIVLVGWSELTGRWWLIPPLALVIAALQFYSRPLPYIRKRRKDLPVLKTFIAPLLIEAVLDFWPVLELRKNLGTSEILIFFWSAIVCAVISLIS